MRVIGYTDPKKRYSVLVYNIVGEPIQDRQRCANTIADAIEIARTDMKGYPFSCASIYMRGPKVVRSITCSGKILKP